MNRLTFGISLIVLAASAFFLFNPPAIMAQPPNCAITGRCTVQDISTGTQYSNVCVPYGAGNLECVCPYTETAGWGYTFDLLSNTCPNTTGVNQF